MKYETNRRVNVRTIRNLANNEGLTLRNGKIVQFKSGWQVGIKGVECKTPEEVSAVLHSILGRTGDIGIWFSDGVYYVDVCVHITGKYEALRLGKTMNQQSIYSWRPRKRGQLIWCK